MLRGLGVKFGSKVNAADDSLAFMRFFSRWVDPVVLERRGHQGLTEEDRARMARDLAKSARAYIRDAKPKPGEPWGWKSPRSVYILPVVDQAFPGLRYIHLVRDPRDMAFSTNTLAMRFHTRAYLTPDEAAQPAPIVLSSLWQKINNDARAYGETSMKGRYLLIRYEQLCVDPRGGAAKLAEFAGVPQDAERIGKAAATLSIPSSVGRWRREDPAVVERINSMLATELREYGYGDQDLLDRLSALAPPPK
jgi:hypothetical protein